MNSVEKEAVNLVANGLANHALRVAVETLFPGAVKRLRDKRHRAEEAKRWVGPVPLWAKNYVKKYGENRVSELTWRKSRTKQYSSGHCELWTGRIVVTTGNGSLSNDLVDQKGTLLHEIAHATTMAGHDEPRFWTELHKMMVAEHIYYAIIKSQPWHTRNLKLAARRARKERSA